MGENRTKIVCTLGPASSSVPVLSKMMHAGMNVARLNFSHGTHEEHATLMAAVRSAAKKSGKTIGIMQDLQGPKIRVGVLPEAGVALHRGERITLTTTSGVYNNGGAIPVTYEKLHRDLHAKHRIFFDDGTIEAVVEHVKGRTISAHVTVPGVLTSHKGMNFPDSQISADPFTRKDREDLLFGIAHGVDWVVLSFVTCADDMRAARSVAAAAARQHGVRAPKIMAKVERRLAIDNFSEILAASDGILLGRGDLGVEIPPEEVPVVQKDVLEACRRAGKPCVVATQMLQSMVNNPRATRAETSDVANAVFDHADAVMLSAESATGHYPAVTVQAMAAVIREAEQSHYDDVRSAAPMVADVPTAFSYSIHALAESKVIGAVATLAAYNDAVGKINMHRLDIPIFVVCDDASIARQITICSGVHSIVLHDAPATLPSRLLQKLRREKLLSSSKRLALMTLQGHASTLSVIG